jgi:hypothetical protein
MEKMVPDLAILSNGRDGYDNEFECNFFIISRYLILAKKIRG